MAFSGHRRSLQLRSHVDDSPATSAEASFRECQARVDDLEMSYRAKLRPSLGKEPAQLKRHDTRPDQLVADNKGNAPSRSLWVGNTPLGIEERVVRSIFERFGKISHVKLPKNQRYVFVNYEDVRDAIDAWEECHDKDILNCDLRVNIRFTSSEGEAKEAKRAQSTRKSSIGNLSFVSDNSRSAITPQDEATAASQEWPNGRPPAGPRLSSSDHWSRVRDPSPPLMRQTDSYRPSDRDPVPEHNRTRSAVSRQDDRRRPNWENAELHKLGYNQPRKTSLPYASSLSPSESSLMLDNRGKSTEDTIQEYFGEPQSSDDPTEFFQKYAAGISSSYNPDKQRGAHSSANDRAPTQSRPIHGAQLGNGGNGASPSANARPDSPKMPPNASAVIEASPITLQDMSQSSTHPLLNKLLYEDRNANFAPLPAKSRTNSPFCRVRKSIERAESGVVRADSVVSEATTSSRSSMSRKKRCAGCRTPESSLMPLTSCSTCPRRFHSGCGDPRPSLCSDEAQFVCGKCLRKQKTALSTSHSATFEDSELVQSHCEYLGSDPNSEPIIDDPGFQAHKAIPKNLDVDRDGEPRFAPHNDDPYSPALLPETASKQNAEHDSLRQPDQPDNMLPPGKFAVSYSHVPTMNGLDDPWRRAKDISVATKYKTLVTCPYWKRNDCKRSEDDCMFAHRDTGIYTPSGTNMAKQWTCPRYFTRPGCQYGESCLYAHADTGYYVGVDGKARKKHLTCHWWRRNGHCRKAEEDCLYSHYDTGYYAEDPGAKPMSGSRFLDTPISVLSASSQMASAIVNDITFKYGPPPPPQERLPPSPIMDSHNLELDATRPAQSDASYTLKQSHQPTNQRSPDNWTPVKAHLTARDGDKSTQDVRRMARRTNAGFDPRHAQKGQDAISAPPALEANQMDQAHGSHSSRSEPVLPTEPTSPSRPNAEMAAKSKTSVKRCRICAKNVFSGDLCSKCKIDEQPTSPRSATVLESKYSTVNDLDNPNNQPILSESMDTILEQELPSQDVESSVQQNVRVLKRVLSGNDMFIANKRSKPNTVTPVARPFVAHIESAPAATFRHIDESEQHQNNFAGQLTGTAVRTESNTTGVAREESDADSLIAVAPNSSERREGHGQDYNPTAQAATDDQPTDASTHRRLRLRVIVPHRRDIVLDADEGAKAVGSTGEVSEINVDETRRLPTDEDSEFDRGVGNEFSNEPGDVQRSAHFSVTRFDKELDHDQRPCKDCSVIQVYCTHRRFVHPMMEQDYLQAPTAMATVCDACRSRHKRCLHGPDHSADGKKCLQWLIERKQRRSTQCDRRTRLERDIIEKAATLFEYGYLTDNETQSRSATSAEEVFDDDAQAMSTDSYEETEPTEDDESESRSTDFAMKSTDPKVLRHQYSTLKHLSPVSQRQKSLDSSAVPQWPEDALSGPMLGRNRTVRSQSDIRSPIELSTATVRKERNKEAYRRNVENLKAKGVVFESDSEGEDQDPIPSFDDRPPPLSPSRGPSDPLHYRPKKAISTNLFDIIGRPKRETSSTTPKLTKGEGLKGRLGHDALGRPLHKSGSKLVQQRAMIRNLQLRGNAHYEVDRQRADSMVTALVEKKISSNTAGDRLTPPVMEVKEQSMTFKQFLGIGLGEGTIEPCVISVGVTGAKTLAFRETPKVEKGLGIFGRKRRNGDITTWPVKDT